MSAAECDLGVRGETLHPVEHQALSFGADTLLVTALVVSLAVPVYHAFGFSANLSLVVPYIAFSASVSVLAPLVTWWLRWGLPERSVASRLLLTTSAHVVPAIVVAVLVIALGYEMVLLGIGVMSYIAGILVVVVSRRFGASAGLKRMSVVRMVCAVGTPAAVIALANAQPHGVGTIGWWSVPMLVALGGAVGGANALRSAIVRGADKGLGASRTSRATP